MGNWEGLPGSTEHRTVGLHRAWCYQCGEWCYPEALCRCCEATTLPEKRRGMSVTEVAAAVAEEIAQGVYDAYWRASGDEHPHTTDGRNCREMIKYRAGQVVRIVWPNGSAAEGTVEFGYGLAPTNNEPPAPYVTIGTTHRVWLSESDGGTTVTVLRDPRPEEPRNIGAIVEAEYHGYGRQKWVRVARKWERVTPDEDGHKKTKAYWVSSPYWGFLDWDHLADPVILHEGWDEDEDDGAR